MTVLQCSKNIYFWQILSVFCPLLRRGWYCDILTLLQMCFCHLFLTWYFTLLIYRSFPCNFLINSGYKSLVKYMPCEYFLSVCVLPFHSVDLILYLGALNSWFSWMISSCRRGLNALVHLPGSQEYLLAQVEECGRWAVMVIEL